MKKFIIVILIFVGAASGYWLARQNQRLFELPFPKEQLRQRHRVQEGGPSSEPAIMAGMDMWQVKEILGPPSKRVVDTQNGAVKEIWHYENRTLFFDNGILTRSKEE